MLTTISLVAAVLAGSVSASPYKYGGYGYQYGQQSESSTTPSVSTSAAGYSTGVIPTGSSIPYTYVHPASGTGPKPYSSGIELSYTSPSGTGYSYHPGTGYPSSSASGHGAYTSPSGTGYVPSSTTPAGTGTQPSGTGSKSAGTGTTPAGTGTTPIGTGTTPAGTGTTSAGTGNGGSGIENSTVTKPHTTTVTSNVPYTTTITHTSVTTYVETITTFVPRSTPIATQESSTYYSSYLSISYITKTVTHTSTGYEVICPETTPSNAQYTSVGHGSGNNHIYSSLPTPGSGYESSTITIGYNSPSGPEQTYAPHTVYGPSVESCAPEKTVYSTVVVEITKTVEVPYSHKTPGSENTYEAHTTTVSPPPYPVGPGKGNSPYHTGTGAVPQPSASGGYLHY